MIAVSKFLFFNTILPAVDIGTDLHAYLVYSAYYDDDLDNYHPKWAGLTLSWMFAPFTIHVGKFFYRIVIKRGVNWREEMKELVIHFPFALPVRNVVLGWRLYRLRFGFDNFNAANWVKVKIFDFFLKFNFFRWRGFRTRWHARACPNPTLRVDLRV